MDGRRMDEKAPRTRRIAFADEHLRSASRLMAKKICQRIMELPRTRRAACALRQAHGLHARRISSRSRARVLSVVGLSSHRFLRADEPLWDARRFSISRQRAA